MYPEIGLSQTSLYALVSALTGFKPCEMDKLDIDLLIDIVNISRQSVHVYLKNIGILTKIPINSELG